MKTKSLKLFMLILSLSFFTKSTAQQNHLLVLTKANVGAQAYTSSTAWPESWIQSKWEAGFKIRAVNFKNGEWFVLMNKNMSGKQSYYFNPSNDIIKEKLRDGYKIQDNCPYNQNNQWGTLYIFRKVSTNPVQNYYFSGQADQYITPLTYNTLPRKIQEGWDRGYKVDNARSVTKGNKTYISLFMIKHPQNPHQIMELRSEFPTDFITNKRSQGYFLSSICWAGYQQKWLVVMTRYNNQSSWTWVNYRTDQQKLREYLDNGYSINGVY